MAEPIVSIIIPLYNCEKYIAATLQSVRAQSWPRCEVIVVDDGSTDRSAAVASALLTPNDHLIQKDHRGAAAARNAGLDRANGEYIQFLDSDDLLGVNKIESQVEALLKSGNSNVAAARWASFFDADTTLPQSSEKAGESEIPFEWLLGAFQGNYMMPNCGWLTPRAIAKAAGRWDDTHLVSRLDDTDYFSRVLLNSAKILWAEKALVYYRRRQGSLSQIKNEDAARSQLRICKAIEHRLLARENSERVRRAVGSVYLNFVLEFHKAFPDLTKEAIMRFEPLQIAPYSVINSPRLRSLVRLLGLPTTLKLRQLYYSRNR